MANRLPRNIRSLVRQNTGNPDWLSAITANDTPPAERIIKERPHARRYYTRKRLYFVQGRFVAKGGFEQCFSAFDLNHALALVRTGALFPETHRAVDVPAHIIQVPGANPAAPGLEGYSLNRDGEPKVMLRITELHSVAHDADYTPPCPNPSCTGRRPHKDRMRLARLVPVVAAVKTVSAPVAPAVLPPINWTERGKKVADALFSSRRKAATQLKGAIKSFKPANVEAFSAGFSAWWEVLAEEKANSKPPRKQAAAACNPAAD